jgi:hypothetical protein
VDAGPTGTFGSYPDGGTAYDPTCSTPTTPGNSVGVGKFCCDGLFEGDLGCPTNGTACTSTDPAFKAIFCTTASPGVTQWFCTLPCSCDSQCGEGAICYGGQADGGGQLGCVPIVCAGGPTVGNLCYSDGGKEH